MAEPWECLGGQLRLQVQWGGNFGLGAELPIVILYVIVCQRLNNAMLLNSAMFSYKIPMKLAI